MTTKENAKNTKKKTPKIKVLKSDIYEYLNNLKYSKYKVNNAKIEKPKDEVFKAFREGLKNLGIIDTDKINHVFDEYYKVAIDIRDNFNIYEYNLPNTIKYAHQREPLSKMILDEIVSSIIYNNYTFKHLSVKTTKEDIEMLLKEELKQFKPHDFENMVNCLHGYAIANANISINAKDIDKAIRGLETLVKSISTGAKAYEELKELGLDVSSIPTQSTSTEIAVRREQLAVDISILK